VGHNPRVPRQDRLPHARPRRRLQGRIALLGVAAGLAVLLAIPVLGTRSLALPLTGDGSGHAAIGQEPTAARTPGPMPSTATPAPPASSPAPTPTPAPTAAPTPTPLAARNENGVPPERIWWERRGTTAPSIAILTGYRWPLAHPRLTLPFGPTAWGSRLVDGKQFHDGVDLASFCNDRVMAAHDGTVLAAGRHYDKFMGWVGDLRPYLRRLDRKHLWFELPIVIVTDDGNGYRSMYAHMWKIVVKPGDTVRAGQLLGYEGMTGRASGCHLHYGLFAPWETATFGLLPDVAKRMKLPRLETARVDPLVILPPKPGINAPARPKPSPVPVP